MKINKIHFIVFAVVIAVFAMMGEACKKPEPPKGKIRVLIDSSGSPAAGATVKVTAKGAKGSATLAGINQTLTTNSAGEVDIEAKLDAVVQLYAYKLTGLPAPKDTLKGVKSLQLVADKKNFVDTVTIRLRY